MGLLYSLRGNRKTGVPLGNNTVGSSPETPRQRKLDQDGIFPRETLVCRLRCEEAGPLLRHDLPDDLVTMMTMYDDHKQG